MEVLVTGATGFVGGRLVPELVRRGHDVTALVRDPAGYDPPPDVSVVQGDLLDEATVAEAFDGMDAVYYLVHSMRAGEDFAERDRRAARNFVAATEGAGVDRVIYLGGLGEEGSDLSDHLASRREVESVLAEGEYELTTFRAAIIVGAGSASFEMVCQLADRLPVMVTPRWVDTPCQPIAISDVVAYLAGSLDAPETAGETFEIGGPDILTYREMLERTAAAMDHRVWILPVPVLTPTLSAYWVDLVTSIPRSVAHPLIDGLKTPVIADDESIRDHVVVDLTPFDEAVRQAIAEREVTS
ncbi:MAG: NAD(P)H-binding protein [Halobacteriaceae archaeon]